MKITVFEKSVLKAIGDVHPTFSSITKLVKATGSVREVIEETVKSFDALQYIKLSPKNEVYLLAEGRKYLGIKTDVELEKEAAEKAEMIKKIEAESKTNTEEKIPYEIDSFGTDNIEAFKAEEALKVQEPEEPQAAQETIPLKGPVVEAKKKTAEISEPVKEESKTMINDTFTLKEKPTSVFDSLDALGVKLGAEIDNKALKTEVLERLSVMLSPDIGEVLLSIKDDLEVAA